ncbi:hypothetical protein E8E14_004082 [Neopestalotiopsis sp. 37M]|nr:hypothetical protein E8E14_004082 [Neopestalotiopsis sp. 37M]
MTDILGAISASLDLAIFITKQVEKIIDAPRTVRVITDDVARLSRILAQLRDTLEPRSGTAIRLKPAGLKNGLESVERCEQTLERLEDTLMSIFGTGEWHRLKDEFGKEDWDYVKPIRFGKRARAVFAYREGDIVKLMTELKECKWDIMLSNSVNQLYLAQLYPEMYARDSEKLDYLQVLCEYMATQKLANQGPNVVPVPPPSKHVHDADDIFNPNAVHIQAAFDIQFINIHEPLEEDRLDELVRMSQNLQMQIQTSTKKKGSKRRTGDPFDEEELRVREAESMRRAEELKRMEEETMSKEEKVRIKKEELRRLKERLELENSRMSREETPSLLGSDAGAYPTAYAGSAPPAVPPNHDPVTDLINEWIGAPEATVQN